MQAARLYEDLIRMGGDRCVWSELRPSDFRAALSAFKISWRPRPRCLNAEAVASFVRAMDALGQRVPRSALVRSAAAALNVLRVAIAARCEI
eukprot:tig00020693_g13037.t1